MTEYWVNYYSNKTRGYTDWPTRFDAEKASQASFDNYEYKTLYRIHVILKIKTPKYENILSNYR